MKSITITGRAVALANKYTRFDLANPQDTPAHRFCLHSEELVKDGVLDPSWASDGFRHVGFAEITVTLLPREEMLTSAVDALRAQKQKVLADAQLESVRIEREIQQLLAITHDPA